MGSSFYDDHHAHSHSHSHHHSHSGLARLRYVLFCVVVGLLLLLYAIGVVRTFFGLVDLALLLVVVAGYPLFRHAMTDLLGGRLSSHLTVALAAVAAVAIGEYFAAAEVMFIMLVGEGLEHYTVDRAKGAIAGFIESQPRRARVRREGREEEIDASQVLLGDTVLVRPGERVPVDGTVTGGASSVDQSTLTGEPMPAPKGPGDEVFSGSLNEHGALEIRAERVGDETTLARIGQLIEEAQSRRAPIVRTADRLAKYFLPAVVLASGAIYLVTGEMMRTVAALIVACPCALVLATPAAVAAAIARLGREGVLVKGGEVLEALASVQAVALDKTGTLTVGRPRLERLVPAAGVDEGEALSLAAAAESSSEHLLGRALVDRATERELELPASEDFELFPGQGVAARVQGRRIVVGNLSLLRRETREEETGWLEGVFREHAGETGVAAVADGRPLAFFSFFDPLRPDAAAAVHRLQHLGLGPITMVTGDDELPARRVAREAGIADVRAALLPADKVEAIRSLRPVVMVGDGINDAPSLAAADVGLAIGHGAADISAEAAQVVLLEDELLAVPNLIAYARKVVARIRSSILFFAFGVNFAAVGLAAAGWLQPAAAAVVHQGASLAVILSSMRLLVEGKAAREAPSGGQRRGEVLYRAVGRRIAEQGDRLRRRLGEIRRRTRTATVLAWFAGLALLTWVLTGVVLLRPEQTGLVLRYGRLVEPALDPGLHLRLPWPLERVERIAAERIRLLEIGFRARSSDTEVEGSDAVVPVSTEWNSSHAGGPFEPRPEESLMLTGDENLVETYAVIQYSVSDPARYLFAVRDPERLLRITAERTLRQVVAGLSLDSVLTSGRQNLEESWQRELSSALADFDAGILVLATRLRDVHPPLEVVDAFRQVASAQEERETRINEAEGYLREQVPLARGRAEEQLREARGASRRRIEAAVGESAASSRRAEAWSEATTLTSLRLYLETVEEVLAGRRKIITDGPSGGRRRFLYLEGTADDGAGVSPLTLIDGPASEPEGSKR